MLWNQQGTGIGSLLFAGMARSYRQAPSYNVTIFLLLRIFW